MITWFRTAGLRLLLAIGLAFSLWIYVSFRENPNVTSPFQGVPVETENLGAGLIMVDRSGLPVSSRQTVNISAEGPETSIQALRPSDIRAFADLSGFGAGEYQVPVNVATARSGFARVTFSADPAFLPFRIEQAITRTVPLTVEVQGNVPFSFEQLAPQTSVNGVPSDTVQITGPQNRVDQVVLVRATANVNQLTANYSSPRPVEPIDAGGAVISGVTVIPANVEVLVPIVSSVGIKRVPIVPQVTGRPATGQVVSNVAVTPEFVTLTGSSGPLDAVESISTESLDLAGASGTFTRTVKLNQPPPGVTLLANEPDTVTLEITTRSIERPFTVTLPAQIVTTNPPAGLLFNISPDVLQVELSGNASDINALGNDTLQGSIDLSGLDPGSYNLEPTFNLPNGITITNQPRVAVTLRVPATAVPTSAPTDSPTAGPTALPNTGEATPTPAPALPPSQPTAETSNEQATATP